MSARRVVVTGVGMVSPLGCEKDIFWNRLISGESGISAVTRMDVSEYSSKVAGEVKEFDIDAGFSKKEQRQLDLFSIYGIAAARSAVADSGIDFSKEDPTRTGVIASSGVGGLQVFIDQAKILFEKGPSRMNPFMIPKCITNIVAGHIAIEFNLQGPNYCITTACASATHSLGDGLRLIQRGEVDMVVAGGTEAPLCEFGIGGFCALKALSTARNDEPTKASRPFDAGRDGFIIAEGAGILVLEEYEHAKARGADIYCELAGFGQTCDAHHITAPDPEGRGAARAIKMAYEDAGVSAVEVDYINAHGTSTQLNDKGETKAVKIALGEEAARKTAMSSTKSMTGHMLGAAGGVEGIACALAIKHGVLPPTINYETPDPECDLDYVPNEAREKKIRACLSNSLGFGGHNGSICFKAV